MYCVLVQLGDGEFQTVATRDELEEAVELIEGLNVYWHRKYVVCDSETSDIDLTRYFPLLDERYCWKER